MSNLTNQRVGFVMFTCAKILSKSYKPSRRFITDILPPRTRSVRGQYISYKPTFEVYNLLISHLWRFSNIFCHFQKFLMKNSRVLSTSLN